MKILRVNMSTLSTSVEDLPADWQIVGGRGLSARILRKEVAPDVDPLAPEAKLVIATGPIAGTMAPSCGRISVGGKSPLTLGIKEANAGGPAGQKMDKLGYRAIILEGAADDGKFYLLNLTADGASLDAADKYVGMKTYDLAPALGADYDAKATFLCIGPVGERKLKSATVTMTDKDGDCSRHAARGGLGAVMGAKGLKAIVLDDRGVSRSDIADKVAFNATVKEWAAYVKTDQTMQGMSALGTPGIIVPLRSLGSMPALNYGSEPLEGFEALAGDNLDRIGKERGGRMDACMPGCLVGCSVVYHGPDGKHLTSSYEYETLALMGTNLGIVDPDDVAKFDRISDELGIDTIELGSAMGVAASVGKMTFGDAASAYKLFDEVAEGTEFGNILANGVVATAKALGVDRIPAFKGQAIPAHDPRATKATGVTYHTSPMGADHTAGITYDDPMNAEGQVERSLKAQVYAAMQDTTGYCNLAGPGDKNVLLTLLKDLFNARFGISIAEKDLIELGKQTLRDELAFNEGTEVHTAHPKPDWVRSEALAPTGSVFDVSEDEIAGIWDMLDGVDSVV